MAVRISDAGNAADRLDVITIGRSSVDLYGEQFGSRLEDIDTFAKSVGGCPSNIAIGTARLGLKSGLITGVGDEQMGRFILEQMKREGVATDGIKIDKDRLTALVILSVENQDSFPLIFYRENCADMALNADDIDPTFLTRANAVLVTGTHFSKPNTAEAQSKAIDIAAEAGMKVIIDIDYRPNLWGLAGHGAGDQRYIKSDTVSAQLRPILARCDLIVGTEEEILIASGEEEVFAALVQIREISDGTIVLKRGPMGCVVFPGEIPNRIEDGIAGPGFPVEIYNVLGAGDAFLSGFLRGWLRGEEPEICATWANACGAFAVSRLLCSPESPTWPELEYFLEHGSPYRALRKDESLNHIHWATTRRSRPPHLLALDIDHRTFLEGLADRSNSDRDQITAFKSLAVEAVQKVAEGRPEFGIFLDDTHGSKAIMAASGAGLWIGRSVEEAWSRPLRFGSGQDIGSRLIEWPVTHTAKCLVYYHPFDPPGLKGEQLEALATLYAATRTIGRELLVEVIAGQNGPLSDSTVATVLHEIYEHGVKPDWWKIEPLNTEAAWEALTETIERNDPWCRGVLAMGTQSDNGDLEAAIRMSCGQSCIKGFAAGQKIFGETAEQWLTGAIDDITAVDDMASRLRPLVELWDARHG